MVAIGSDRPYGGVGPAERRAERHARIVEGALEVFASRGYAGASVEAICQAASVSTRDFYVEFESREACLRAIYDSIVAEITRDVIDRLESADGTLAGEARAALTGFVECFARDERKARVNFVEAVGVSPDFERHRREALHAFRDLIVQRAAPILGVGPADLRVTAMALVGATQESLIDWVLARDSPEPLARLVEELAGIYVAALERLLPTN